jgi:uncharacterized protein GlcG (DUF336 family)
MNTKHLLLAAGLATTAASAWAQTATLTEHNLSVDAAAKVAMGALEKCRADGYKVSVTVINRHMEMIAFLRDNDAQPQTAENSDRKAYTAFATRVPSGEMSKRPPGLVTAFMLNQRMTSLEGGIPIRIGNETIGGVGVGGAPGGDKDAACAQAGIDRIAKELGN